MRTADAIRSPFVNHRLRMKEGLRERLPVNLQATDSSPDFNGLALPAALFTANGKRAAMVEALDARSARVAAGDFPEHESIAILVRHGVRVFGTLRRTGEGAVRFDFDDALDGWRQARFVDDRRTARPVTVSGYAFA